MAMTILLRAATAVVRSLSLRAAPAPKRRPARGRQHLSALRDASDEILADLGLASAQPVRGGDFARTVEFARFRIRPI